MMRSLNSKREAKKKALLLEQKIRIGLAILSVQYAPNYWIGIVRVTSVAAAAGRLGHIARMPAKVLRLDGKIDKRRYRRYVSKHRRVYKIKTNQGHQNEKQETEIIQKVQAAISSAVGT